MANEYVTAAAFLATLSLTGETYADADVALALEAASRMVDAETGRRFYTATETRYFTITPYTSEVVVTDLTAPTSVTVDMDADGVYETTWVATTNYTLAPANALLDGQPYTTLRIVPTTAADGVYWPAGYWPYSGASDRLVKITGTFGWPSVPAPIKTATSLLANRLLRRLREAPLGVVSSGPDGEIARVSRTDPDVAALLSPYTLHAVTVG